MTLNKNIIIPELSCITLCLTQDCNLQCKYCCVNHNPNTMSLEVALKSVDLLCSSDKTVHGDGIKNIIFFGGEPTLHFHSLIKPIVEYCTVTYPQFKFNYSITTNATLLSRELIQFFIDNNFTVLLSIDGGKIAQDTNRIFKNSNIGSFDVVIDNIKAITSKLNCPVRGTFTTSTCELLFDSIKFLNSLNTSGVALVPNALEEWSDSDINTIEMEIKKYVISFLSSIHKQQPPLKWASMYSMLEILLHHDTSTTRNGTFYCGLGLDNPTVLYNGTLVSCDYASNSGEDSIYTLGDIYTGIDTTQKDFLVNTYNNNVPICEIPDTCNDCKCKAYCVQRTCHYFNTIKSGDMNVKSYILCKFEQMLYDAAVYIINIVGEEELKTILNIK